MKKKKWISIILMITILVGTFEAVPQTASAEIIEQSELQENNTKPSFHKTSIAEKGLKAAVIKWAIKHINDIIEQIAPYLSEENAEKLRNAGDVIIEVFQMYENAKSIIKQQVIESLQEALSEHLGNTSSTIISKLIGGILDTQNDSVSESKKNFSKKKDYILPHSNTRKVTMADIKNLTKKERRLARNEIYARHGRRFLDKKLQKYFDSKNWYYGTIEPEDFVDSEHLSKLERRNAKFILKHE